VQVGADGALASLWYFDIILSFIYNNLLKNNKNSAEM
jgi:hypothetical protein